MVFMLLFCALCLCAWAMVVGDSELLGVSELWLEPCPSDRHEEIRMRGPFFYNSPLPEVRFT